MNDQNELAVLLVLCCLVGATVFLCFSLGALNVGTQGGLDQPGTAAAVVDDPVYLQRRMEELQQTHASPMREIERLASEIEHRKQQLASAPISTPAPRYRTAELAPLQRQLDEISRTIEQLTAEIGRLKQSAIPQSENEKDLERLRDALERLEKQIEEKRKALAAVPVPPNPSIETDMGKLRETIAGLDEQIDELRKYLAGMRLKTGNSSIPIGLTGSTTLKNPVMVECTKGGIVFHPEGRQVTMSQLESGNPFQRLPGNADGIVFLVRPDGFMAFLRSYELAREIAKKIKLSIAYGAIDADWKPRF
jgi:prefoldin subunit 5